MKNAEAFCVTCQTRISPSHKTVRHKKGPDKIGAFRIYDAQGRNRKVDTRIFSPWNNTILTLGIRKIRYFFQVKGGDVQAKTSFDKYS